MCSGDDATDAVMDSDVVPSAPRAGEDILSDEATKPGVVLTDVAPPPPRGWRRRRRRCQVSCDSSSRRRTCRRGATPRTSSGGPRPVGGWRKAVVFMPDMQTVLHEVAHVSPAVLGMMNDLAIIKMPVGTREARGRAERGRQGAR